MVCPGAYHGPGREALCSYGRAGREGFAVPVPSARAGESLRLPCLMSEDGEIFLSEPARNPAGPSGPAGVRAAQRNACGTMDALSSVEQKHLSPGSGRAWGWFEITAGKQSVARV